MPQTACSCTEAIIGHLSDRKWHSTVQIGRVSVGGFGYSARIAELRERGFVINTRRKAGTKYFEYKLAKKPKKMS